MSGERLQGNALKALQLIELCSDSPSGYPGLQVDMISSKFRRRFERNDWVSLFTPHNPVHKERLVITPAGRAALQAEDNGS